MSARMSDYLYTHPYQPCSCALCGLPKVSAGFPLLTKLQNSDSRNAYFGRVLSSNKRTVVMYGLCIDIILPQRTNYVYGLWTRGFE